MFYNVCLGLGIGVCSGDGRYCNHLIYNQISSQNKRFQTYGSLILHPKRGIIIWLDYNLQHPNGVIMSAGMDGEMVFYYIKIKFIFVL